MFEKAKLAFIENNTFYFSHSIYSLEKLHFIYILLFSIPEITKSINK